MRLKAEGFVASKNQRQVIRRLNRYLEKGDVHERTATADCTAAAKDEMTLERTLTIDTELSTFTREKYELYKKYCNAVHEKDEVTEESFTNFLVSTGLKYVGDAAKGLRAVDAVTLCMIVLPPALCLRP